MREIEFRGKAVDGKWYYGSLLVDTYHEPNWEDLKNPKERKVFQISYRNSDFINHYQYITVDPETIGQYTGLKDKNGKKIYEGDIFEIEDEGYFVVQWSGAGYFELQFYGYYERCLDGNAYETCWGLLDCEPIWNYDIEKMSVIGNKYDNPELLEGRDD